MRLRTGVVAQRVEESPETGVPKRGAGAGSNNAERHGAQYKRRASTPTDPVAHEDSVTVLAAGFDIG